MFRWSILTSVFCFLFTSLSYGQKNIDGGYYHSVFLCSDSTVWVSGTNFADELGIDTNNLAIPAKIEALHHIVAIAAGGNHTLALNDQGKVFTWGLNSNGQLGDSLVGSSLSVIELALTDIVQVATGESFSFAIRNDGAVYAWGKNNSGQLGLGHNQDVFQPTLAPSWGAIKCIDGGQNHAVAVNADGTVWASGNNSQYQLGNGTTVSENTPQQVAVINNARSAAAGFYHSAVVKGDGSVWTWGYNDFGSLGNGTNQTSSTPTPVSAINNADHVVAGQYHTAVRTEDNNVYTWGINYYGQLGNGSYADENTPHTTSISNSMQIFSGIYHTGSLDTMGNAIAWGLGANYQLGDGSSTNQTAPVNADLGCSIGNFDMVCITDANFFPSTTNICEGSEITFTNMSQNAFEYVWSVNGQVQSQAADLSMTFSDTGSFEIQMIANPHGCADTASLEIVVDAIPSAVLYAQGPLCVEEDSVQLTAVGSSGSWSGVGVSGNYFNPSVAGEGEQDLIYAMSNGVCTNEDTLTLEVTAEPQTMFSYTANGDTVEFNNGSSNADSYEWYFGDGQTSNNTNPDHVFEAGTYNVVLLATNECGTQAYQQTITIGSTGIATADMKNIKVYPNPTVDWLFVEQEDGGSNRYSIVNILGEELRTGILNDATTKIKVSDLATGQYLLRVSGDLSWNESFVVK